MVINAKEFQDAIEAIELGKGISRETILQALEEAMKKGYRKELGGMVSDMQEPVIEVNIDPEQGIIEMFHVKDIVDEVEDDFLQVSKEDAKQLEKEKQGEIRGDKFYISASIETLRKATANSIKAILKQKFAEAEKNILYETFKDKINTMITGKVEKVDERGCSVNIGKTSVFLPRKQMIGDEKFTTGSDIRLFVEGVENASKTGARINVSRASEGFLKALFNEEIREIYDGTIIIKAISREAGERSKVAVYTTDPNVDPAGACIGQNGTRIQKIVSQLGNGQAKEKIDIIAYSDNPGLYVMEALKPAHVVGVKYNQEEKSATVVVKDDSLSLAIGKRGVNARLAVRLTGYNIDIKTESDALEEGLEYQSLEELQALEMENLQKRIEEANAKKAELHAGEIIPGLPEGYVAPQARVYEEESNDFDSALEQVVEKEELSAPEVEEEKVEEVPVKEEEKVEEAPVKVKEVKTTTTLSDLEKTLESESNKSKKNTGKKTSRKKKEEEEEVKITSKDPSTFMSIYSEEELREMDEEEESEEIEDDDVDYDEYDEYYDDDDR